MQEEHFSILEKNTYFLSACMRHLDDVLGAYFNLNWPDQVKLIVIKLSYDHLQLPTKIAAALLSSR